MLTVLINGGSADGLQFTTSQLGLEDRCSIDGAFGSAGTNQGVNLVDKEDDVAALVNLLENLLQALFEVTAVA